MKHSASEFEFRSDRSGPNPQELIGIAGMGSSRARVDPFQSSQVARLAKIVLNARARRRMYFKSSLFSEPAWDILLELLAAEGHEKRVTISTAGLTAGIPATTALRWIRALEREGLVTRADDPFDRRRSFVTLTVDGLKRLTRYFETCHEAVELIGPR